MVMVLMLESLHIMLSSSLMLDLMSLEWTLRASGTVKDSVASLKIALSFMKKDLTLY